MAFELRLVASVYNLSDADSSAAPVHRNKITSRRNVLSVANLVAVVLLLVKSLLSMLLLSLLLLGGQEIVEIKQVDKINVYLRRSKSRGLLTNGWNGNRTRVASCVLNAYRGLI